MSQDKLKYVRKMRPSSLRGSGYMDVPIVASENCKATLTILFVLEDASTTREWLAGHIHIHIKRQVSRRGVLLSLQSCIQRVLAQDTNIVAESGTMDAVRDTAWAHIPLKIHAKETHVTAWSPGNPPIRCLRMTWVDRFLRKLDAEIEQAFHTPVDVTPISEPDATEEKPASGTDNPYQSPESQ